MRKIFSILIAVLLAFSVNAQQDNSLKIKELEMKKKAAVAKRDYKLAADFKKQIEGLKNQSTSVSPISSTPPSTQPNNVDADKIATLELKKQEAVKNGDFKLAGELKKQIENLKNEPSS